MDLHKIENPDAHTFGDKQEGWTHLNSVDTNLVFHRWNMTKEQSDSVTYQPPLKRVARMTIEHDVQGDDYEFI